MRSDFREYIRSFVRDDFDANERATAKLDEVGWEGSTELLAAGFVLAVDRALGRKVSESDVVHFVADIRAEQSYDASEFDPVLAEQVIGAVAYGADFDIEQADQETVAKIQTLVIYYALTHPQMDDDEMDAYFSQVEALANQAR